MSDVVIRDAPRAWADAVWSRCLEGLDPVAVFGPEVDLVTHPASRYWAIWEIQSLGAVADEGDIAGGVSIGAFDSFEIGLAWASRFENDHLWTQGVAFFPEHRRRGFAPAVGDLVRRELFRDPIVTSSVFMAYSTNPHVVRYHDKGPSWKRRIGVILDAGGPGVDLHLWQVRRQEWLDVQ
jgi:hypothetical protein